MTTLVEYPGRDLPPIIQRAIARANDPSVLQDLSPSYRWALSILLRRVSADDGEDIFWVKRENFAKLIGASEATVYRILAALERLGLIQRIGQKRSAEGAFTVGELRLSDGLCRLLGLKGAHPDEDASLYSNKNFRRLAPVTDVIKNNQGEQFSSKKHSLREPPEKSRAVDKLPADLHGLVAQGLTRPQVFMLMGLAGKAGKRLSDIVAVSGELLRKFHGHELFAYLRSLTAVDKDFAYLNEAQRSQRQQAQDKKRQDDVSERLKRQYAGRWLKGRSGTLFEVYDNGYVAVHRRDDGDGGNYRQLGVLAGAAAADFWLQVDRGEIVAHQAPA